MQQIGSIPLAILIHIGLEFRRFLRGLRASVGSRTDLTICGFPPEGRESGVLKPMDGHESAPGRQGIQLTREVTDARPHPFIARLDAVACAQAGRPGAIMTTSDTPEIAPTPASAAPVPKREEPPAITAEPKPAAAPPSPTASLKASTQAATGAEPKAAAAKKPEVKPPPPPPLAPELYHKGLDLLREVMGLREVGRLSAEKILEAEQMAKGLRAALSQATGKEDYVLADLEKKSITFRQGEELARALCRAVEGMEVDQAMRAGRRKLVRAVGALVVLAALAALFLAGVVLAGPASAVLTVLGGILVLCCLGALLAVWKTGLPLMSMWRAREQKRTGLRFVDTKP